MEQGNAKQGKAGQGRTRQGTAIRGSVMSRRTCVFCHGDEKDDDRGFVGVGKRSGITLFAHEDCLEWTPLCYQEKDGKWIGMSRYRYLICFARRYAISFIISLL